MNKYISVKSDKFSKIDNETGEILDLFERKKISPTRFMQIYLLSTNDLFDLSGVELKVFIGCWTYSVFNSSIGGNCIEANTLFKNALINDGINCPIGSINNAISSLAKKQFLIKKCRGYYLLNPKYVFNGTLSQRTKLTLQIEADFCHNENIDKINNIEKSFDN